MHKGEIVGRALVLPALSLSLLWEIRIVFKIILEVWNLSSLTPASLEKIHTIPFFSLFYLFLLNYRRGFLLCGTPRFFLNRGKGMLGLETWYCWLRPLETFLHGNSWQSIAAFWPFWDCGKVQLEMPKKKKKKSVWYLFNLTILKKKNIFLLNYVWN